jgi:hypothetical protein
MRTFPDLRMRRIIWDTRGAQLRARARKLGVGSPYVAWGLAVAYDNLGELEMAELAMRCAAEAAAVNAADTRSASRLRSGRPASKFKDGRTPPPKSRACSSAVHAF